MTRAPRATMCKPRLTILASSVLVLAALVSVGCNASRLDLDPVPGAQRVEPDDDDDERVMTLAHGVTLTVDPDAWIGPPKILDQVTPVWISLDNESGRPLLLRYKDVRMVGRQFVFNAVPPVVADEDRMRMIADGYGLDAAPPSVVAARWEPESRGFSVAEHMQILWPDLPVATPKKRIYDAGYWSEHDTWADRGVPRRFMILAGLPEGMLADGGRVTGLVYFQRVPDDLDSIGGSLPEPYLELVVDLVDADSGERFGRAEIPLVID